MSESVDHVLLTRFNLPSEGYESLVRASEGWLEKRLMLFKRYCLPSVRHQVNQDFSWIIYFDPASPAWFTATIHNLNHDHIFIPIFRSQVSREDLLEDIRLAVKSPGKFLLTTNLDNDDGLASDFTARIREVPPREETAAVFLSHGLIRSGSALYIRKDANNAFCSVLSPWDSPDTCWANWHNRLRHSMRVVRVSGAPAWLQIIHGSNVSNRTHGRRVSPVRFRQHFPTLLDDVEDPSVLALLREYLLLSPTRMLREILRAALKSVIALVGGRSGPDQLRAWLGRQDSGIWQHLKRKGAQNGY